MARMGQRFGWLTGRRTPEAITRKPKGHDFDTSRHRVEGQAGWHMSVTGG